MYFFFFSNKGILESELKLQVYGSAFSSLYIHLFWTLFLQVFHNTHSHLPLAYTIPLLLYLSQYPCAAQILLSVYPSCLNLSNFLFSCYCLFSPHPFPSSVTVCPSLLSPATVALVSQTSIMRIIFLIWGFLGNWRGQVIPNRSCLLCWQQPWEEQWVNATKEEGNQEEESKFSKLYLISLG